MKKRADDFAAKMQMPGNQFRAETLRNIGGLSLGAFGLAAALRGARGLADTVGGSLGAPPKVPLPRQVVRVPVPARPEDEEDGPSTLPYKAAAAACLALRKGAQLGAPAAPAAPAPAPAPAGLKPGVGMAGRVLDAVGGLKAPDGSNWGAAKETLLNHGARSVAEMPWAVWGAPLAIGGAAYLGHKITDSLLDRSRANETDSELAAARRDYERAIAPPAAKLAAPGAAGDAIDRLYDTLREKGANWLGPLNGAVGGYGLLATLLAGGAGVGAYNWARDRSEDTAVESALKQRREQLFARGPAPIQAVPVPVAPERPRRAHERPRERPAPPPAMPKAANTAAAAQATLARFDHQQAEQTRRTMAMLGIGPDGPAPKPAPAAPPKLPSVVNR